MHVHILASGSTGNAALIQMGGANILVDAGISARRIKLGLDAVGVAVENLDAVLVTHEHRDHVAGLPTLSRKYRLPVYARPAAWESLDRELPQPVADQSRCLLGNSLDIGEVKIEPFSLSHDAVDPVGFSLYCGDKKCSLATDLGFVTDGVKKALALADVVILESNHDVDMLKQGGYPWFLKQRILGSRGHLANTDAGWTLARLPRKDHCHAFLAHISQENNRPDLAERTVADILGQDGRQAKDVTLHLTFPDRTASL